MEKHTKICSFSIRKTTLEALDKYVAARGKRSRSELVSELLDFAIDQKKHQHDEENIPGDGIIPEKISLKWYKSLYFNSLRDYFYSGDCWFKITLRGIRMSEENAEYDQFMGKLDEFYERLINDINMKLGKDSDLARGFIGIIKSDDVKILAVRVWGIQKYDQRVGPVCRVVYAVTLVKVKKNIDSKDHFYLDYHAIQVLDVREIGRAPLSTLVRKKNKQLVPGYLYWMPITIFQNNLLVIGVKRRSLSDQAIALVKSDKLIMVTNQAIRVIKNRK
ncbi:CopG family ribbon-helix-helix protein [Dickeya fangzhongdai]|uniref:CopG family ribbon-helix-helix protein n=1 Tax=Dickeya fangzhongdai TaxID=1778540 RepID=UPI0023E39209|nr:ribbon-helix-helix domain-containing protein [Dickeya fangzhongdai]WES90653.1 ribbon-helix-helix domain-containing protein [Dickeya fangzhongdai]